MTNETDWVYLEQLHKARLELDDIAAIGMMGWEAALEENKRLAAEVEALRAQVAEAQAMIPNEHALAVVRRMAYGFDWLGPFDDDDPLVLAFESWLATLPTPEAQP